MAAPKSSRLDMNQCIQGAYDEDKQRLRTDSEATIVNADIDVSLESFEDNVAIATPDGTFLAINPDGSINVVLSETTGKTIENYYNEVNNVVSGITTTIVNFTPNTNNYLLQKVEFSGSNIAEFEVIVGSSVFDKKRTYFGSGLNGNFDFDQGIKVNSGVNIRVIVNHSRPTTGNFNARIQLLKG